MGVGIDFGTTNTALAARTGDGVRFASYALGEVLTRSFRSLLFFGDEADDPDGVSGVDAVAEYLEVMGEGRLLQSVKTYLGSSLFESTIVRGRKKTVEQLVARILSELWRHAAADLGLTDADKRGVIMGRPVNFAAGSVSTDRAECAAKNALATKRLLSAAAIAGFSDVTLMYEPMAAAFHYEGALESDAVVLVADFGGGTTDYTVMHMGPGRHEAQDRQDDVLVTSGVEVAGDNLDAKLIRHVVAPRLGLGSTYTEMGSTTDIPASIYRQVERWHHLSLLKSAQVMSTLQRILRGAEDPEAVEALIHIVDWNQGFHLHRAIERTKVALSESEAATFVYEDGPIRIEQAVNRSQFEAWIEPECAAIASCLDEMLEGADLEHAQIDRVFMTGGTSFVPKVRGLFVDRFGQDKLHGGDELVSIAGGLALQAGGGGNGQGRG